MMTEKQFVESQKECASMLGMSLSEYQNYCNNIKVPGNEKQANQDYLKSKTYVYLNYLGLDSSILKKRKDS